MQTQAQWDKQAQLIILDPIMSDRHFLPCVQFALAYEQALLINTPPSCVSFWVQFARDVSDDSPK